MSGKNTVYTVVDVETNGMRSDHHRVIDIGIIRIENGVIVSRLETFLNPGVVLSPSITEINSITNEMLAGAPQFDEMAYQILALFDDATFVAHNASFDYGFLKREFQRIGIEFKKPVLCSVKLSRALYPNERSHNLDALIARHGLVCERRHRAMPDALVVAQFLKHSENAWGKKVLSEKIDAVLFAENKPALMDRRVLAALPDCPGVYFFHGKDDEILYIGKSKNIRTRVRSHFSDSTSRKEIKLCAETASVTVQKTSGELGALLLESHLIKEHLPHYNRALRRMRSLIVARRVLNPDGYATVVLESAEVVIPEQSVIGLFRTATQAQQKLRSLAKEYQLCQKLLGLEKGTGCFGYQLETCAGACLGHESAAHYNERFDHAFKSRQIKNWPYAGPIMIEEKGTEQYSGTVFLVDQWRLVKSYRYDHGEYSEFIDGYAAFEYDLYKILARFILDPKNARLIRVLSQREFSGIARGMSGNYESVVQW